MPATESALVQFDGELSLTPVTNFHWDGLRLDVREKPNGWEIAVRPSENLSGVLRLRTEAGWRVTLAVVADRSYTVRRRS